LFQRPYPLHAGQSVRSIKAWQNEEETLKDSEVLIATSGQQFCLMDCLKLLQPAVTHKKKDKNPLNLSHIFPSGLLKEDFEPPEWAHICAFDHRRIGV